MCVVLLKFEFLFFEFCKCAWKSAFCR